MLCIGRAPLHDSQVNIVCIFLGVLGALAFNQLGPAWGIGQHRVFYYVLFNRLNQRVIRHSLHKNGTAVVLGRGRNIHLQA